MNRGLRKELAMMAGLAALGLSLRRDKPAAALLGLCAVGLQWWPTKEFSFEGRVALITGGSRGLGMALAEGLLREGARVVLLARDADELQRAQAQLEAHVSGAIVLPIPCDITNPDDLTQAFVEAGARFGRLDILINNAGAIVVGPYETMTPADFEAQLKLHLHAAMQAVNLALPAFKRQGEGRIVNIASIGGDLPVPHMVPYCASKFALAGYSESITTELAPANIRVTTVYPGLMRTGSPIQAVFKGNHEKEFAWFSAGDVTPGLSVPVYYAARRIIDGVRYGNTHVSYPLITKVGIMGHAVFPETYAWLMRTAARFMPKGTSSERKTGAESKHMIEDRRWYQPFRAVEERAEQQCNQAEKYDANFNLGV